MSEVPETIVSLKKEIGDVSRRKDALRGYLCAKIDQLLVTMGSKPLESSLLSDKELLELDPIGTISDAFGRMLANVNDMNVKLRSEIAERMRTEEALREKEERFRTLAEFASDWAFWRGPEGEVLYVAPACEQVSGYTPDEFYEFPDLFITVIHPEEREMWRTHCHTVDKEGMPGAVEFRIITKDGEARWISHVCRPVHSDTGEFLGVRGSNSDITARKRSEQALKDSEDRLRDFFENAIDLIQSVSPEGRFLYVNRAWRNALGYTREEIGDLTIFDIISPSSRDHCMNLFGRVMSGEDVGNFETTFVAKNGREILVEGHVNCRIENGIPVSSRSIFRDVTEKRKMEEEFRKAGTLESIGILAGGIAHDFNNILTAILGNIALARGGVDPDGETFCRLTEAERASMRAQELTRQLLTFSTGGAPIRQTASISGLVEETARFALRGSNVRCEFAWLGEIPPVDFDSGQISQVIQNIVINAVQAMPGGGIVRVRGENVVVPASNGKSLKEGNHVKISIADSGCGIPREHLPKVFDPFFTTKETGTGLGLATSYSIIKRHEGVIAVESEPGKGTTFSLFLPASRKEVTERSVEEEQDFNGKGRILLMDDEEMLRSIALDILEVMGYRGTAVGDGQKAIDAYLEARDAGNPFDAVIMDLTIPGGMGGKEAVGKLLEADPDAKIIVSSGYSNDPVMSDFRNYGFCGVIEKPYRIGELGKVLKEAVSGACEAPR